VAGYTRQSSADIVATAVVRANPLNLEFDQVLAAFNASSGHKHDGTTAEGAYVPLIADSDALNKVSVDTSNNRVGVFVEVSSAAVEQIRIQDGVITPVTDNDIDLGTSSVEFKDLYLDGTATIDTLQVDESATITANLTVNGNTTLGNAASDTVTVTADVASPLLPSADDTHDLGAVGSEWRNLYIDGTANIDALVADTADINGGTLDGATIGGSSAGAGTFTTLAATSLSLGGTAVTSTAAELNILDGVTSTATELNILDGVTATTAELNIMDGVTATTAELNIMDGVTSTAAELNILDGVTSTTAELNILDGVTSTATELNILDGVTSSTAELNILDGVTATAAELNILDGVTSTAAELNILDGVTSSTAELNILDGVTSTATELNKLDGATVTVSEINILDGDTSATSTTVADADRVVMNDNGTMVQVAMTDLAAYLDDEITAMPNLVTTGALNSGSITSGFGTINTGSSTITTTGNITGGNIIISDGGNIGSASDTDAIAIASGGNVTLSQNLTVTGDLQVDGTTTTVNSANMTVDDKLIELGNGRTGSASGDAGIVIERGDDANAFIGFDESANKFTVGTGTFTGASTGDLTITTGTLVANIEGNVTGNVTGSSGSTTGNAATATALETARNIGGVSFNGTANINLPGVNASGNQDTSGNAATATALATARTIAGQSFDGTANITIAPTDLTSVTATATEINIVDGDTSATSTTLADADRVVVNDAGTMKQVALTDFETYFESSLDTLGNVTTVGALNSGSITSGFGSIDNGSSAITTTGTITYGSLSDGSITITAFVDEDNMSSNSATLVPTQQSVKAYVDTVAGISNNVTGLNATGAELNTVADFSAVSVDTSTAIASNDAILMFDNGNEIGYRDVDLLDTYFSGTTKTLTNKTLTSPTVSGLYLSDSGFSVEGSSADANETTVSFTNPTADRTITFPNATGNVAVFATAPTAAISDGSNGQFLKTDGSGALSFATVSSVGGSTGVDFNDNVAARFGTGNDLSIYHGGSFSIINNSGASTTPLIIGNDGDDQQIRIRTKKNSESGTTNIFIADGATGEAQLLHLGSEKLETTSSGVTVTGTAQATSRLEVYGSDTLKLKLQSSGTGLRQLNLSVDDSNSKTVIDSTYSNTGAYPLSFRMGGSEKMLLSTAGALTLNGAYTLPTSDGSANQVLTTNGSGAVTFADAGGGADLYAANESSPSAQPSATGANAIAIGDTALSQSTDGVAIGKNALVPSGSNRAVAIGSSRSYGADSFAAAIGTNSASYGTQANNSIAIGYQAKTQVQYAVAIGESALVGTSGTSAVALGTSYANGADSFAAAIANNSTSYGATGANSIAMGQKSKASGNQSTAIGNFAQATSTTATAIGGYLARAEGYQSLALGTYAKSEAPESVAIGFRAKSNTTGKIALNAAEASSIDGGEGYQQRGLYILRRATTDATQTVLSGDGATPASANSWRPDNNSAHAFTGTIIAREKGSSGDDYAAWEVKGAIMRADNAASMVVGMAIINSLYHTSGASAWDVAIEANTTLGSCEVKVTGAASTNIDWVATIDTSEVINA